MKTDPEGRCAILERELARRTEELREALQHQAATSEILRVIAGSRSDVQPVFETIAERAARLCNAQYGFVFRIGSDAIHLASSFGVNPEGVELLRQLWPQRFDSDVFAVRAIREGASLHLPDVLADPTYRMQKIARVAGFRAVLGVPLLREGQVVGSLAVARADGGLFSDKQVDLLRTFASQAVIAIENGRLFNELRESLEHQTATSEILRVIAGSRSDVQPVFDIIAERAARLCNAGYGLVFRFDGDWIHLASIFGMIPEGVEAMRRRYPLRPGSHSVAAQTVSRGVVVNVADVLALPEYEHKDAAQLAGFRGAMGVPLLREGRVVGAITVTKAEVGRFGDKQVELLKTFASQAVIAIENVRLFQALRARTQALTRSVAELRALGEVGQAVGSTLDLQTVLTTIVSRAAQLSGCYGGVIYEFREATQTFHIMATHRMDPEHLVALQIQPVRLGEGAIGKAGAIGAPVQVADILDEDEPVAPQVRHIVARLGFRSLLAVPFLREQRLLGGLVVWREACGRFADEVVSLLQTFAAQSVLAIHNARLYREIQDKSRELEVANHHKSEFLASMSHELRTPLNAIIGFSEVLRERMFGELNPKQAEYIDDIHSSGQHLLSLINDILDLSKVEAGRMELELSTFDLPLAIGNALTLVGERAARQGIRLERDIDARLGAFTGDERKFKQILLNLLSNAVKFTPREGRITVQAVAVDSAVEVSVSDTGAGIAPEHREIIFEEFRQVRAEGAAKAEGTGLGLALTRKFVELHGGSIRVEGAPGAGSRFTFRLPARS